MGTIFEDLVRKFNEALNENPGEHFTPRDVVHLMVDLLFAGDGKKVGKEGRRFDDLIANPPRWTYYVADKS